MPFVDFYYPAVAGATAISLGALYLISQTTKPRVYPFDAHLQHQSYPVNENGDERRSPPQVTDTTLVKGMTNVCHLFMSGVERGASKPCFGQRKSQAEQYHWETYSQVQLKVARVASLLDRLLGDSPKMVGIQARNCAEWLIIQLACAARGHVIVPLYDTFGQQACREIITETQTELVFCGTRESAYSLLQSPPPCVRHVMILNSGAVPDTEISNGCDGAVRVHCFADILTAERDSSHLHIKNFESEQLFMICYTSGSTGVPKGVMITHSQFIQTIKNLCNRLEDVALNDSPVHMCYLPLAHILEQLASLTTLLLGGRIGFLTGELTGLLEDLRDVQPTYLFTVPRVLARVYSKVHQRLSSSRILSRLLHHGVECKIKEQEKGYYNQTGIWDFLFFRKIRNVLGGRIRAIVCGGAPASKDVIRFSRAAFSCPVLPAYGLTESCGVVSIGFFGDCQANHVGALCPELTAKLVDVPEMGLFVAHGGVGELVVRGPNCTQGYFNDPVLTKRLIDADGWLHTGDLASWNMNGALEIVGRRKASFKLSQGEYVSPDKVEAMYQLSPLVDQVYVDGNSLFAYAIAIIVPNFSELRRILLDHRASVNHVVSNGSEMWARYTDDELCANAAVKQFVLNEITRVGKANGLKGFELAKSVHLTSEPFTIENQLLTANLKLSRVHLRRHFSSVIDHLYRDNQS